MIIPRTNNKGAKMAAFFKKSTKQEDIASNSGGGNKYISDSGIYDVNIHTAFVGGTEASPVVELYVNYNGEDQPLYGNMRLTNNDGSENFAARYFNQLLVIADVADVSEPVLGELPIGKAKAMKDVALLEDIQDIECKVAVRMEYGVYKGNITEKTNIVGFYAANGASATEIVNGTEIGVDLEKAMPYATNVTYKDGLDAEQVAKWIADKRPKGTAGAAGATTTAKPSFGAKKFGSK